MPSTFARRLARPSSLVVAAALAHHATGCAADPSDSTATTWNATAGVGSADGANGSGSSEGTGPVENPAVPSDTGADPASAEAGETSAAPPGSGTDGSPPPPLEDSGGQDGQADDGGESGESGDSRASSSSTGPDSPPPPQDVDPLCAAYGDHLAACFGGDSAEAAAQCQASLDDPGNSPACTAANMELFSCLAETSCAEFEGGMPCFAEFLALQTECAA